MAVLITGGAGYIGSHAAQLFLQKGIDVIILDDFSLGHKELVLGGKLINASTLDKNLLFQIFSQNKIDAVLHFAAFAYVGESVENPAKYYENNVTGTLLLLEAMKNHGVKNFIFSSTCATYGVPKNIPITENEFQNPINPYGRSKLMVEKIAQDFEAAYGMKFCIFRYFNAAGADLDGRLGEWHEPETHLIPIALDVALGKRPCIKIFGSDYPTSDGTCVRDYIHVCDLADAHFKAYEYLLSGGKSVFLNLGTKSGASVLEIIREAKKITGKEIAFEFANRRAGDPPVLIGSAKKAKEVLGWQVRHSDIQTILQSAWAWHKKCFG